MRLSIAHLLLIPLLAACVANPASTPAADAEPLFVRHSMQAEVNPAIVAIWDVGNLATNDTGGLDPAQMTPALWASLTEAAGRLADAGDRLAAATNLQAASPGNQATEDYETSMTDIQRYLDADPQGFRDEAAGFAQLARSLEQAANAHNTASTGDLLARMDAECTACHTKYWYPEAE